MLSVQEAAKKYFNINIRSHTSARRAIITFLSRKQGMLSIAEIGKILGFLGNIKWRV